jgi:hypothetical protein
VGTIRSLRSTFVSLACGVRSSTILSIRKRSAPCAARATCSSRREMLRR